MFQTVNRVLDQLLETPCEFLPVPDTDHAAFRAPPHCALAVRVEPRTVASALITPDAEPHRLHALCVNGVPALRRYSDFAQLRLALRRAFGDAAAPPLPPRAFLGSGSGSRQLSAESERSRGLERFAVLALERFFKCRFVGAFFNVDAAAAAELRAPVADAELARIEQLANELRGEFASLDEVDALRGRCVAALRAEWADEARRREWLDAQRAHGLVSAKSRLTRLLRAECRIFHTFVESEKLNREARARLRNRTPSPRHSRNVEPDEIFQL